VLLLTGGSWAERTLRAMNEHKMQRSLVRAYSCMWAQIGLAYFVYSTHRGNHRSLKCADASPIWGNASTSDSIPSSLLPPPLLLPADILISLRIICQPEYGEPESHCGGWQVPTLLCLSCSPFQIQDPFCVTIPFPTCLQSDARVSTCMQVECRLW
jgi:hypothetical protein